MVPVISLDDFARALDPVYLRVLGTSLGIAGITTLLALLIGYPTAWAIARLPKRWRLVVLLLVVLPFWTNFLVRTYAWIVLLNSEGPLNGVLVDLGLISEPLTLLYTPGAVVAGLLYAYLPLMILPLYVAIDRLDPELREAATDLGAGSSRMFLTVTLPMTLPGAVIGSHLRVRAQPGQLRHPGAPGRRQDRDGRQPHPGPVPQGARLAVRAVLALSVIAFLAVLLVIQSRVARRYAPVPMADTTGPGMVPVAYRAAVSDAGLDRHPARPDAGVPVPAHRGRGHHGLQRVGLAVPLERLQHPVVRGARAATSRSSRACPTRSWSPPARPRVSVVLGTLLAIGLHRHARSALDRRAAHGPRRGARHRHGHRPAGLLHHAWA